MRTPSRCLLMAAVLCVGCAAPPRMDLVQVVPLEAADPPLKADTPWQTYGTTTDLRAHVEQLAREGRQTARLLSLREPDILRRQPTGIDPARNLMVYEPGDLAGKARVDDCIARGEHALVDCAQQIHSKNVRDLDKLTADLEFVRAVAPSSQARWELEYAVREAVRSVRRSAAIAGSRSSQYGLYAGPNYSLGGDGRWKEGFEALARFNTQAFRLADRWVPRGSWQRGYTEVSYTRINALENAEEIASDAGEPEVPGGPALPEPTTATVVDELDLNPFLQAGGYLRFNTGVQLHLNDWMGAQLGVGYSSLPNDDDLARMEPRRFGGLHFETLFGDGSYGSVFLGYARDHFWQREVYNDPEDRSQGTRIERDFDRWNVDLLFIFSPTVLGTHAVGRLFVDTPISGDGPSDVRASVLLYYSLSDWLRVFQPIQGAVSRVNAVTRPVGTLLE